MAVVAVAAAGALDVLDRGVRGFRAGVGDPGVVEGPADENICRAVTDRPRPVSPCRDPQTRSRHDQQHPGPQGWITGVYGAVLKKISRKTFGEVPEPLP